MRVTIYDADNAIHGICQLEEAIPGDDVDAIALREQAKEEFAKAGRFWVGGGAAPLYMLMPLRGHAIGDHSGCYNCMGTRRS